MPIIPTSSHAPGLRQLPGVSTPTSTPEDFGAGIGRAVAGASQDIAQGGTAALFGRQRQRERADADAADAALTRYTADMDGLLNGSQNPDGSLTPGLRQRTLAAAANAAADFTAAEKQWFTSEKSPYAGLTPRARQIFEDAAQRYSARFRQAAVNHELDQTRAQRAVDRTAAFSTNDNLARNSFASPDFEAFANEAALRKADADLGDQVTLNPDGSRSFASPAAEALHRDASAAASLSYRAARAEHFINAAANLPVSPSPSAPLSGDENPAEALLARAEAEAANLPPEAADRIRASANQARRALEFRARAAKADADDARRDAQLAERDRLDKTYQAALLNGFSDSDAAIKTLASSPDTDHANRLISMIMANRADIAAARAKADKAVADAQAETLQREVVAQLAAGYYIDPDGRLVRLSTADRAAIATRYYTEKVITEPQWKAAREDAMRDEDTRVQLFSQNAVNTLLPSFADAFARDPAGNFTLDDKRTSKGVRRYDPAARTPFTDAYTETKNGKEYRRERAVLLSEAADALNTVKSRMAADPDMTPEAASEWFRQLISGTVAKADRLTIRQTLAEEQALTAAFRTRLQSRSLPQPKPAAPAKP